MQSKHFASLDGLRGIAAMLVVFSHYARDVQMFPVIPGEAGLEYILGALGVMIFFALSGFLMMHVTNEVVFNASNVRAYFSNRLSRVLPLYFFVLMVTCLYQVFFAKLLGVAQTDLAFSGFEDTISTLLLHIFLIRGDSVYWTISVEILFYMLFPLIWLLTKGGKKKVALCAIAFAVLVIQISFDFSYEKIPAFSRLNTTIQFFLLGTIVYSVVTLKQVENRESSLSIQFCIGLLTLIGLLFLIPDINKIVLGDLIQKRGFRDVWSTHFYFLIVVGGLLIATTSFGAFNRILTNDKARYLGRISFSLYLTHRFIVTTSKPFGLADYSLAIQLLAFFVFYVPIIIAISALTYKYIEQPSLRIVRDKLNPVDSL